MLLACVAFRQQFLGGFHTREAILTVRTDPSATVRGRIRIHGRLARDSARCRNAPLRTEQSKGRSGCCGLQMQSGRFGQPARGPRPLRLISVRRPDDAPLAATAADSNRDPKPERVPAGASEREASEASAASDWVRSGRLRRRRSRLFLRWLLLRCGLLGRFLCRAFFLEVFFADFFDDFFAYFFATAFFLGFLALRFLRLFGHRGPPVAADPNRSSVSSLPLQRGPQTDQFKPGRGPPVAQSRSSIV